MTQKLLKLSQEALARLKDVEKQVRELVAENKALKEALAKQEPVAIVDANDDGYWADILPKISVKVGQMLYTNPPQRSESSGKPSAWVGLTDDEITALFRPFPKYPSEWDDPDFYRLTQAIEAKLKEKNT